MLTQLESTLRGGPENDYPTGDFVWPCKACDAEFHGEQYDYICYKCAKEEDRVNKIAGTIPYIFPLVVACCAVICGVLSLW